MVNVQERHINLGSIAECICKSEFRTATRMPDSHVVQRGDPKSPQPCSWRMGSNGESLFRAQGHSIGPPDHRRFTAESSGPNNGEHDGNGDTSC